MQKVLVYLVFALGVAAFGGAAGALLAFPTMWLWNYLARPVFGLPDVTWIQAWALNVLTFILFRNVAPAKKS